jgi:hypothetical protein
MGSSKTSRRIWRKLMSQWGIKWELAVVDLSQRSSVSSLGATVVDYHRP